MYIHIKKIIITAGLFFLLPMQLFAQSVSVSFTPEYPKAGDSFTISLESFLNNLDTALIVWKHDGEVIREGVGLNQITFSTDQDTRLSASITTQDGVTITQTIPVTIATVDVLWEVSNSYTPPFYKGKALPTEEGSVINAVAIAEQGDKDNLVYRWQKNNSNQGGASGVGRDSFSFTTSVFESSNQVGAFVESLNGSSSLYGSTQVNPVSPEVVFYKNDQQFGRYLGEVVKNNQTVDGGRLNLVAVPYFLSTKSIDNENILMDWFVNGVKTPVQGPKNQISLDVSSLGSGLGNLDLSFFVSHASRLFEEGTVNLSLKIK